MNTDEEKAFNYLKRMFDDVRYEPRGHSKAPDFLCDGRFAVEVRRIADLTRDGGREIELHTSNMRVIPIVKDILRRLSLDTTLRVHSNYGVWVRRHQQQSADKKALLSCLRQQLQLRLILEQSDDCFEINVDPGMTFAFRPVAYGEQKFFLTGLSDFNSGGLVVGSYARSIAVAIADKSFKQVQYRRYYPEHWLLLVDHLMDLHIEHMDDAIDLEMLRRSLIRPEAWDRILVINPRDLSTLLDY